MNISAFPIALDDRAGACFAELGMTLRANLGITEFTHKTVLHRPAQLSRHGLHAIANTQYWHTQFKHNLRCAWRITFNH